jgi:hypothetical protein
VVSDTGREKGTMLIQETWIDKERNCINGESGKYEPFTDDTGKLYRAMVKEYGRCTGHVYIDTKDKGTKVIGLVFIKRQKYDDCDKTFLLETWVTLYDAPDEVMRREHHHFLKG